jgi:hypothetical protein
MRNFLKPGIKKIRSTIRNVRGASGSKAFSEMRIRLLRGSVLRWESGDLLLIREKIPYLMNWCLENTLPEDVDVNLFKCYGILSIMEPDWKLITEIYNHGL